MLTIADYLSERPDHPVYFLSPAGPMRVIRVEAQGKLQPIVVCRTTDTGARVHFGVLYSTQLFSCSNCLDTGEVDSTDIPGMSARCPECQMPNTVQQYP